MRKSKLKEQEFHFLKRFVIVNHDNGHTLKQSFTEKEDAQFFMESELGVEAIYYDVKEIEVKIDFIDVKESVKSFINIYFKDDEKKDIILINDEQ